MDFIRDDDCVGFDVVGQVGQLVVVIVCKNRVVCREPHLSLTMLTVIPLNEYKTLSVCENKWVGDI